MKIGMIVADKDEYFALDKPPLSEITIGNIKFSKYNFQFFDVILAVSGVGIANAARVTQMMIDHFQVDAIANYGNAGAIAPLNVGTLVIPNKIFYYDVVTPWYPQGQIPGELPFFVNGLAEIVNHLPIYAQYARDNLGTGGAFISDNKFASNLKNKLDISIFDMEAAAIAQIARANSRPVYILKSVSDVIGRTDVANAKNLNVSLGNFSKKAYTELVKILQLFFSK